MTKTNMYCYFFPTQNMQNDCSPTDEWLKKKEYNESEEKTHTSIGKHVYGFFSSHSMFN